MLRFSTSAEGMRSSEIRKLMKLASDPSIISFSGGMPENSLFPTDLINELWNGLDVKIQQQAFQYCPTSGYPPLINALKDYLKSKGLPIDSNEILITTGAQQALNLSAGIFLNRGDTVITETPSFIGALAAFKSYGANILGTSMDEDGIIIGELEKHLDSVKNVKLLYISPTFHNPAGITYSKKRKLEVIDLLKKYNVCLIEDDPYGELYFNDSEVELTTPIKLLAKETIPICYTGSFSKIFGPGIRLGWLLAPTQILEKCELAKQSADACSPTFTQVITWAYLTQNKLGGYLKKLRVIYKRRSEIMLDALKKYMPKNVFWTVPKGGFYIWVTMPENINASDVFQKSLKNGAAFVIGSAFDPNGIKNNSFRLAYSNTSEDKIEEGVKIISKAVSEVLNK